MINLFYSLPIESLFFVGAILCCVALIRDEPKYITVEPPSIEHLKERSMQAEGDLLRACVEAAKTLNEKDLPTFGRIVWAKSITRKEFEEMYPPMETI